MSLICIDPSIDSTGVAYWRRDHRDAKIPVPTKTWLFKSASSLSWEKKAYQQSESVRKLLLPGGIWVSEAYIEMPQFFGSARGTVASQSGSILKLSVMVGMLFQVFKKYEIRTRLIPVNDWKGQLSKDMVKRRVLKVLGHKNCAGFKEDIWDAVGIGLSIGRYI